MRYFLLIPKPRRLRHDVSLVGDGRAEESCYQQDENDLVFEYLLRPFGECERQFSGAVVDGGEGTPPQHDGGSLLPQRLPLVGTRCPLLSAHLAVLRTVKYMKKLVGNRCSISNFIF